MGKSGKKKKDNSKTPTTLSSPTSLPSPEDRSTRHLSGEELVEALATELGGPDALDDMSSGALRELYTRLLDGGVALAKNSSKFSTARARERALQSLRQKHSAREPSKRTAARTAWRMMNLPI